MDSLKNYIQIECKGAPVYLDIITGLPSEASGLYINKDLPGLTIRSIDKIANSEEESFLVAWDRVQDRALRKFRILVKGGWIQLFASCVFDDITFFEVNKADLAMPLLYFLGVELMIAWLATDRINEYTTLRLDDARDFKDDLTAQFQTFLKVALQTINSKAPVILPQTGEVYTLTTVIP